MKPDSCNGASALLDSWPSVAPIGLDEMRGRYCVLEPFSVGAHVKALFGEFADSGLILWEHLPYGPFLNEAALQTWYESTARETETMLFAIREAVSKQVKGCIAYWAIVPLHGRLEIGHVIFGRTMQRTRIGTEAIYLMLQKAFSCGYRRCEWRCASTNTSSIRTAERIGFLYEGTFRQHMVVRGRNRDTCCFSMTDADWRSRQTKLEIWLDPRNFDVNGRQKTSLERV